MPVYNTQLLDRYASIDPRVSQLGHFVKCWAKRRGLKGAKRGFLSSYAWMLQVIKYAQHCGLVPCLEEPPFAPEQPRTVDGHAIRFFEETEIRRGLHPGAAEALAEAKRSAKYCAASLQTLAIDFMDFCYANWADSDIEIPVPPPAFAHTHTHTHTLTLSLSHTNAHARVHARINMIDRVLTSILSHFLQHSD